jgi:PIN domain nuclease of toxin-antitoxin system
VILLDTQALIWLDLGHRRANALRRSGQRLYVSPASVLEIQFLQEAGRLRLREGLPSGAIVGSAGCLLDDPDSAAWFQAALDVSWTRDPFDRLIIAHAVMRGWRLATADAGIIARLPASGCVEL